MAKQKAKEPTKAPAKSSQVKVLHSVLHKGKVIKAGTVIPSAEAEGIPGQYLETV